jgi:hypothetical protein
VLVDKCIFGSDINSFMENKSMGLGSSNKRHNTDVGVPKETLSPNKI